MRGLKGTVAIGGALLALALAAPAAMAVGGPADWMYEPTSIAEVHLELPPASIEALEAEPKEYVEGTFALAETDGTPGTAAAFSAPLTVGIELKGNLGSLRSVNEKAAFKIKFDKFVEGQRFLGLEKMTLNNMVQDPSMLHEATTYEAFHDMGVPAPHVGYVYLTVNGKSYGLHLNIETQDAQSLENEFGTPFTSPPQHLYAGEYGADVSTEPLPIKTSEKKWEALEVAEGKKKEKGDLEALLAAAEATTPPFAERMASVADLTEMTKDWLVEKYVGNWDGYAGQGPDYYHPNNYYLYSDTAGRFQMMPWGTDQTWQSDQHLNFGSGGGVLFGDCMADTAGCRESYLEAGREALGALNATSLDTTARCAATALRPWQELEAATSEQEKLPEPSLTPAETLAAQNAEVAATRAFIASRPGELASFLDEPAPPARMTEPTCPPLRPVGGFKSEEAAGSGTGTTTTTTTSPAAPTPPVPATSLRFGSPAIAGRAHGNGPIDVRAIVSGPGRVTVHAIYGPEEVQACRGTAEADAAGSVTVPCKTSRRFAELLDRRWRRIVLVATFAADDGTGARVVRSIRLAKR
jgi:CotH kinase protein